MLNDIMDRAMAKSQGAPKEDKPETPTQREAPGPEKKDAPPSPPEKNKPSSAYVYLAVLFGAAFLMLLLAYFVQQRNNDDVLDDLRSTTAGANSGAGKRKRGPHRGKRQTRRLGRSKVQRGQTTLGFFG